MWFTVLLPPIVENAMEPIGTIISNLRNLKYTVYIIKKPQIIMMMERSAAMIIKKRTKPARQNTPSQSANLVLTKCFNIKLYLDKAHRITSRTVVDFCVTISDFGFDFNSAALSLPLNWYKNKD